MIRWPAAVIAALMLGRVVDAETAKDGPELTRLLNEFLAGASRNDAAAHDRFWADELVYTGSAGRRVGKADILRDVRSAPAPRPEDPKTTFGAEDVRIQQYGDTAVVAFRLVGTTDRGGKSEVAHYLNTGTFLRRHGKWQVVGWQATRMPRPEEESRKAVATAEAAFHRAMLRADVKDLAALLDDGFVWTHRDGEQMTGKKLLEELGTGRLKYTRLETSDVTVSLHGDTAVVRGVSTRQRSSIPAGGGDDAPFTAFYTLTFVNRGGAWKAVAMHTSRP
jgi:ketosteroid isomerase-like protein